MSTKAELMTVITAVIILLPKSNVHIYIDFKAIIDEFLSIQSSLKLIIITIGMIILINWPKQLVISLHLSFS